MLSERRLQRSASDLPRTEFSPTARDLSATMIEAAVAAFARQSVGRITLRGVLAVATVDVRPEPVNSPWVEGFVLDRHVISSRPIGYFGEHMQFETTRSPLAELVYQLKYRIS